MTLAQQMQALGAAAREAASQLAQLPAAQKTRGLQAAAAEIRANTATILAANAQDMEAATHLDAALRDRLMLNEGRIEAMATGIETIALGPDPVGRILAAWDNPANGLHFEKTAVPLGVIGMIYESRPNVTADATALAIKSGNAIILRGGSESFHSSRAILAAIQTGFAREHLPPASAQCVPTTDREAVHLLLTMHGYIDVIIPRGGRSLTERVQREAQVPTLLHLDGNCHTYIDKDADPEAACRIILNAKLRRPGICGATESLLLHRELPAPLVESILKPLLDAGCELRGDTACCAVDARINPASEADWSSEYLAPILSVAMVETVADAIAHINRYGSHHTDAIITRDENAAQQFCREVDSAIVLVNASTQFADGGEFGFGGEIGIATGRLHARGPVGAAELTTYKYVVTSSAEHGTIRAG